MIAQSTSFSGQLPPTFLVDQVMITSFDTGRLSQKGIDTISLSLHTKNNLKSETYYESYHPSQLFQKDEENKELSTLTDRNAPQPSENGIQRTRFLIRSRAQILRRTSPYLMPRASTFYVMKRLLDRRDESP